MEELDSNTETPDTQSRNVKALIWKILSWTGLSLGLLVSIFIIVYVLIYGVKQELFYEIVTGFFGALGFLLLIISLSLMGLLKGSKDYSVEDKKSVLSIILGCFFILLTALCSWLLVGVVATPLGGSSDWFVIPYYIIYFSLESYVILLVFTTILGPRLIFRGLRLKRYKLYSYLAIIAIILGIIAYGYSGFKYGMDKKNGTQAPTKDIELVGNYKTSLDTSASGLIEGLVISFDAKSNIHYAPYVDFTFTINGTDFKKEVKLDKDLNKGEIHNFSSEVSALKLKDIIGTDGEYTITKVRIDNKGNYDNSFSDSKTVKVTGILNKSAIDDTNLTINVKNIVYSGTNEVHDNPVVLYGTITSKTPVYLVQLTFDQEKTWPYASWSYQNQGSITQTGSETYNWQITVPVQPTKEGTYYTAEARVIDAHDNVIYYNKNSDSYYITFDSVKK